MKTKIKDKSNGAIIEVNSNIASEYVATGRYEIYKESEIVNKNNYTEKKVGKYVSKIRPKM